MAISSAELPITTPRASDWRPRLNRILAAFRGANFDEETHHCGHLAAAVHEALTGERWIDRLAPDDQSREGLERTMAKLGASDLKELMDLLLPRTQPFIARDGDLGAVLTSEGWCLGVFSGSRFFCLGKDGLGRLDRTGRFVAWSIG